MNLKEAIAEMSYMDGLDLSSARKEAWAVIKAHLPKDRKYARPSMDLYWISGHVSVKDACTGRVVFVTHGQDTFFAKIPAGARLATVAENFKAFSGGILDDIYLEECRNGRQVSQCTY